MVFDGWGLNAAFRISRCPMPDTVSTFGAGGRGSGLPMTPGIAPGGADSSPTIRRGAGASGATGAGSGTAMDLGRPGEYNDSLHGGGGQYAGGGTTTTGVGQTTTGGGHHTRGETNTTDLTTGGGGQYTTGADHTTGAQMGGSKHATLHEGVQHGSLHQTLL